MKKVRPFREKKKSKKTQNFIIGAIISFILIFSGLAIFNGDQSQSSIKYNKFKFTLNSEGLFLKQNDQTYQFYTYPAPLENLSYDRTIDSLLLNSKMIYLSSDEKDVLVDYIGLVKYHFGTEIYKAQKFTQNAYTTPISGSDLPLITCINATADSPVIYFKTSNQSAITMENNCITVNAQVQNEFLAMTDRIIYGYLGVIQ